ncbi:MAG: hypothetical protein HY270_04300 [Deltaproteobacteria bacterium]|nr:hypothetical protein [Deltaproteobacteria bacterium]
MLNRFVSIYAVAGMAAVPTQPLLVSQRAAWVIVGMALFVACGVLWLLASALNPERRTTPRQTPRPASRLRPLWPATPAHRSSRA